MERLEFRRRLLSFILSRPNGFSLQIPVHRSSLQRHETAVHMHSYARAYAHTPSPQSRCSLRKFRKVETCVDSLVLSFVRSSVPSSVRSFVRASVRPSARWYWPCNWAQTLSSARPAKDYTPACPEGLEPNVLV